MLSTLGSVEPAGWAGTRYKHTREELIEGRGGYLSQN